MSGNKLFIDSNIAIYLLNGDITLAGLLHQKKLYISFITQLELLSFNEISIEEQKEMELFIKNITVIDINYQIKLDTIKLRKKYSLNIAR